MNQRIKVEVLEGALRSVEQGQVTNQVLQILYEASRELWIHKKIHGEASIDYANVVLLEDKR